MKIESMLSDPGLVDFVQSNPWLCITTLAMFFFMALWVPVILTWPKQPGQIVNTK